MKPGTPGTTTRVPRGLFGSGFSGRTYTGSRLAVHSFRRVFDQLGTIVAKSVEPVEASATCRLRSRQAHLRQQSFELLGGDLEMRPVNGILMTTLYTCK